MTSLRRMISSTVLDVLLQIFVAGDRIVEMYLKVFRKFLLPDNLIESLKRFPLASMTAISFTIFLLLASHRCFYAELDSQLILVPCAFFVFLGFYLFAENDKKYRHLHLQLLLALILFLIFQFFQGQWIEFLFLFIGVLFLVTIAPYINEDLDIKTFWKFNEGLVVAVFFSCLATSIFCGGLLLSLGAIDYLFDIRIPKIFITDIFIVAISLFCPLYTLSRIPKDFNSKVEEYPKGFIFIFSYILVPLLVIYLLILYAYIAKIIIEWNLPKGQVAYMVIAFGSVGILTQAFVQPIVETGSKFLAIFYRYFYYSLLAPIVLLFVGIGVRINEYGITEPRYVVLIFALWLLFSSLYFIFKKELKIKYILLVFSLASIMASFGPWSATNVSVSSQVSRLEKILKKNDILVDGEISKKSLKLDPILRENITSIVNYLLKKKQIHLIQDWFSESSQIDYINKPPKTYQVMEDLGLNYIPTSLNISSRTSIPSRLIKNEYKDFLFYIKPTLNSQSIFNVKGFEYFVSTANPIYFQLYKFPKTFDVPGQPDKKIKLITDSKSLVTVTHLASDTSLNFDLEILIKRLIASGLKTGPIPESKRDWLTLIKEKDGFEVQLTPISLKGRLEGSKVSLKSIKLSLAINYPE